MQANMDGREVKELVSAAVGRLAPGELSRFDEVWQAYLDDPRSGRQILKSRDVTLGAGIDVVATAITPLLAAITGEALVVLVTKQAVGLGGKVARHRADSARRARRAALTSPAPDPADIQRTVMRALLLDIARRSGCTEHSASAVTEALVSVFTQQTGPGDADAAGNQPGVSARAANWGGGAGTGKQWRGKSRRSP